MPEALVMLPEPVLMNVEIALGGLGQLLRAGHRPARGRDSGVDETNDIQPIRHNTTPVLADRRRKRREKEVRMPRTPTRARTRPIHEQGPRTAPRIEALKPLTKAEDRR